MVAVEIYWRFFPGKSCKKTFKRFYTGCRQAMILYWLPPGHDFIQAERRDGSNIPTLLPSLLAGCFRFGLYSRKRKGEVDELFVCLYICVWNILIFQEEIPGRDSLHIPGRDSRKDHCNIPGRDSRKGCYNIPGRDSSKGCCNILGGDSRKEGTE